MLADILKPEVVLGRHVRLMFQDEARFGRMVRIRRCWAPSPSRPVVDNGYERQFVYVYGAVSPMEGELDWMICREMNTLRMGEFLTQVATAHAEEFIVMVVDGASSHVAKDLQVPQNNRLFIWACSISCISCGAWPGATAALRPGTQSAGTRLG